MAKYKDPNTGEIIEVGEPTLNPELVAGKERVSDTTPLGAITSASLTPQPSIDFKTPEPISPYPVSSLQFTGPEQKAQVEFDALGELNKRLIGESAYRAEQEHAQGISELQRTQSDLSSRLKAIQNEALAIPLQLQQESVGRGRTAASFRVLQGARLRENAIQALSTASLLEASRGNLATSLDLIDRAVAQKFDPIREEISVRKANLDLILQSPSYSLADKRRAEAQKRIQEDRERALARQELDQKEIGSITNTAIKYGLTDPVIMERISKASSVLEAQQLAAPYLQDPKAKYELEEARLNNILKQEQITSEREKRITPDKQTEKESKEARDLSEKAKAQIPVLTAKIAEIDNLFTHKGLNSRVGPSGFARKTFAVKDKFGAGQDFASSVQTLTSKETLDYLVNLKQQGGTLGALNQSELDILKGSATKINNWEVKDANGIPTGEWNVSEFAFKKELKRIQDLAKKALERAGEQSIDIDEKSVLDKLWQVPTTSGSTPGFNPANYF